MLPSCIILKILIHNTESIHIYRQIFYNDRVKRGLQEIMRTELYMWQYLINNYDYKKYINNCLHSNNIEIVKLGIKMGATNFNRCLNSTNIKIILLGLKLIN